jgi:hypothetical protein
MPANDELTFIELSDFTPGITSAYQSAGGPTPSPGPGETPSSNAQIRDTWGCYGHPNGGLHPLPGAVETITETLQPISSGHARIWPGDAILATHVMSPVVGNTTRTQTSASFPATPDLISVVYGAHTNNGNNRRISYRIVQYRRGSTPATRFVPASWVDESPDMVNYAASVAQVTTGTVWDESVKAYQGYTTDDGESVPGHQPGRVGLIYNINGAGAGTQGRAYIWPRIHYRTAAETESAGLFIDAAYRLRPYINELFQNPQLFPAYIGLSHQNRYLFCKQAYTANPLLDPFLPWGQQGIRLGSESQFASGDFWRYTPPNDLAGEGYTTSTPTGIGVFPAVEFTATRFGQATSGFGAAASMNASELYLVKQTGGGTIVRGNIDSPQVTDYPGIPSTMGAACVPAVSPLGMIYGTVNGVYAWSGADQAQNIAPQLEGWFWKPQDGSTERNEFNASHGKFMYLYPFVFAPNNWVMDTRTGGWFRLSDPDDGVWKDYNATAVGSFYAHPGRLYDNAGTVATRFSMNAGQHNWSWRSQPIPATRSRTLRFREINIVAQGYGQIVVTLHGINGLSGSATFTVDSDAPIAQILPVAVDTHDVEIQVEAFGDPNDPVAPAPILYRMSVGHQPGNTVGKVVPPEPGIYTANVASEPAVTAAVPRTFTLNDLFASVTGGGTVTAVNELELDIVCQVNSSPVASFVTIALSGGAGGGEWEFDTVPGRNIGTSTVEVGRTQSFTVTSPPFDSVAGVQTIRFTPDNPAAWSGLTAAITVTGGAFYRIVGARTKLMLGF